MAKNYSTKSFKYHSTKARCRQGHMHDSKKEAARCNELHTLEKAGVISDLKVQKKFELIPSQKFKTMPNERSCSYIADFTYFKDGVFIIEDAKGCRTSEYIIKRKLLKQKLCTSEDTLFIET